MIVVGPYSAAWAEDFRQLAEPIRSTLGGGDSGGPLLYDATNTIVAVNSFGLNEWCRGVDFMYRIDQAAVQSWIRSTIGETQWALVRIVDL